MTELVQNHVERQENTAAQITEKERNLSQEALNNARDGLEKLVQSAEWQRIQETAGTLLPLLDLIDVDVATAVRTAKNNGEAQTKDGGTSEPMDAGVPVDGGASQTQDGGDSSGVADSNDGGDSSSNDGSASDPQDSATPGLASDVAADDECIIFHEPADPNLRSDSVKNLFDTNMCRLDADGDGFVSEEEVDAAMRDGSYTGKDAQLVAMLKEYQDELEELSDDEFGDENDGITAADMARFDELQRQKKEELASLTHMRDYGKNNFSTLDADGNGYLTGEEIDAVAADSSLSAADRKALEEMKERLDDIEEASNDELGDENDGITAADLDEYLNDFIASDEMQLVLRVDANLHQSGNELAPANLDIWGGHANELDAIRPEAIRQGAIGDCYFMSAVASLAGSNPEAIRDMIQDNHDGTYTVTFPGAPDEPITVEAPTEAEMARFAEPTAYGSWPCILEKAYGKYCNEHWYRRGPLNLGGGDVDQEGADGGSLRNAGLRILTGNGVDSDTLALTSEEELDRKLTEAFADGRPVVCGINNEWGAHPSLTGLGIPLSDNRVDDLGIPAGHEYSVVDYNPETKMVKIMNPWGNGEPVDANGQPLDGVDDGIFELPLSDFKKYFSSVAYAERP
ncbi:MAG TPA: C2 family cysteine protease [Candidatus Obscuribacterales bacterium]